jgi:hypothetical protein
MSHARNHAAAGECAALILTDEATQATANATSCKAEIDGYILECAPPNEGEPCKAALLSEWLPEDEHGTRARPRWSALLGAQACPKQR